MTRYGLVCLLLGALAWGQAANSTPAGQKPAAQTPAATKPGTPAGAPGEASETKAAEVSPTTPVITINGLCDQKQTDSANCKTVLTRADFEKIVDAVQPNMPARMRRQFATRYASALVMATKAEQMGLDKGASYDEHMKLARIQVLSQELNKAIQDKAAQISDKDIEDYYHANTAKFEQADLDRIYIPKTQQQPPAEADKDDDKKADKDDKKDEKAAKTAEEAEQKRQAEGEKVMKDEADKVRAKAAAGGDFNKLQEEAYQVGGIKTGAPNTTMGKMRRSMLPPAQSSVLELKPGEVSQVIADQNGYFIYKMKSKDTMTLDQAREEIKGTLRSQRIQEQMQSVQQSATPTLDEAYFGPEGPGRGMPPGMPMPPRPSSSSPK